MSQNMTSDDASMWDGLDAATVSELEDESTEDLINRYKANWKIRYKANWMIRCEQDGVDNAEHMGEAVKEMGRIEDVIESRGVLTKAELQAIRSVNN